MSDAAMWTDVDGAELVCSYYQDIGGGEGERAFQVVGGVFVDGEPTGEIFLLHEVDGEVVQVIRRPVLDFERLQTMVNLTLTEYIEDEIGEPVGLPPAAPEGGPEPPEEPFTEGPGCWGAVALAGGLWALLIGLIVLILRGLLDR